MKNKKIEFKKKIAAIAKENPHLSPTFIKSILISQQEIVEGKVKNYIFGK